MVDTFNKEILHRSFDTSKETQTFSACPKTHRFAMDLSKLYRYIIKHLTLLWLHLFRFILWWCFIASTAHHCNKMSWVLIINPAIFAHSLFLSFTLNCFCMWGSYQLLADRQVSTWAMSGCINTMSVLLNIEQAQQIK